MHAPVRGRFAPSPSGRMHLGNLFSALLAWLSVRAKGGVMVLRMEDLDPDRCREEYALQLADDLRWLGLDWDEGYGAGGPHGPYRQRERTERYAGAFQALEAQGLVYPCFCTRAERLAASAPHRSDGSAVYPGTCRTLTQAEREQRARTRSPAWRLMVPDRTSGFTDGLQGSYAENLGRDCGDFILRRSDGVYAYQLELLGLPSPEYYHVPLLLAPDGRRLSKRERDLDMGALRRRYTPEELTGLLAHLAGLLERSTPVRAGELVSRFDWARVRSADVIVDDTILRG